MPETTRYARHLALAEIGAEGQARLAGASVLIVGIGGLGCPAAQYLAASGVGHLVLNDFDSVDISNLPRQILFTAAEVGRNKAVVGAEALRRLNGEVRVDAITARLDDAGLTSAADDADVILDCTDNFGARLAINRAAVATGTPLVSGAALRFEGQLSVFEQREGDPCYRCVYSDEDELLGDCAGNGVLAPVPGVIGCLMAAAAIELLTAGSSALNGTLSLWDALAGSWHKISLARDSDCPVCGHRNPPAKCSV